MGLLSDSKSYVTTDTTNTTNNQDSRQATTDQGVTVRIDGSGSQSNISYNYTTSDPTLASNVAGAGSMALLSASGTIDHAADTVRDLGRSVENIGNTNANLMRTLSGDSNATVQRASDNGLAAVRELAAQVSANQSRYLDEVNSLASQNMNANAGARDAALSFGRYSLDNSLSFARDATTKSQNQSDTALSAIRQTSSTLLDFINQNIKPADQQAFQATLPWLVGGAVIIGVFAFAARSR